jgi:hypothetical protein
VCRWRVGYIAYPGQQLLAQFGGVQDLGAELLKVRIQLSKIIVSGNSFLKGNRKAAHLAS